jgi:IMP dehydrogenase/GMP reductase
MRIENDIKLDFDDVLIRPQRSTLSSRKDVSLIRKFKFLYSDQTWEGVPIMASNMDTTGTTEMHQALSPHSLIVCLHKHYSPQDIIKYINNCDENLLKNMFISIGISDNDILNLMKVCAETDHKVKRIMIDVANGYSENFINTISWIRNKQIFNDYIIAAGNVVTANMAESIILAGADIVKCGIGNGCLAGDTRILMADGTYKNIKDIQLHDKVINKNGDPVDVVGVVFSGFKRVVKYKSNIFYKPTLVTDCHKHLIYDLSEYSESTYSSKGAKAIIENNQKQPQWKSMGDKEANMRQCHLLIPAKINFDIPSSFSVVSNQFIHSERSRTNLNSVSIPELIRPTYELGYLFGTFLGDGHSRLNRHERKSKGKKTYTTVGNITWHFGKEEKHIANKIVQYCSTSLNYEPKIEETKNMIKVISRSNVLCRMFNTFYDEGGNKRIPSMWWCQNVNYLKGILDGLIDSDGHISSDGRKSFANTSEILIEQFMIIFYLVEGYFPSMQMLEKTTGNLNNVKSSIDDLKQVYSGRSVKHPNRKVITEGNHILHNMRKSSIEVEEFMIPTYDIEVDCDTHSFIANNTIVHNSVCSTRIQTGIGYPQLSSVIECADAVHGLGGHLISDGGCNEPGDFAKAFGGGADFVMSGSYFAGHDESGGNVVERNGEKLVEYYGMSSNTAQERHGDGLKDYRSSEGRTTLIPYKGKVEDSVKNLLGGLRSTCTYVGAHTIKEVPKRTTFIRVNQTHNKIFENNTIRR